MAACASPTPGGRISAPRSTSSPRAIPTATPVPAWRSTATRCASGWPRGEVVGFDNSRVLHGRTALDESGGRRHLRGTYIDRDELLSRIRMLERRR
ncbi:MAG: TauD/TfdA family dioxygenase [Alphaproteobacteria bacterium]|nr:TauD/TfdA family dioxygenase [Alphaproteobacteria bacterium]